MAAVSAQGGRSGGGGGSSGAGGGPNCGTGSGRSGLLDKVRSRFLGTDENLGGPGGGQPTFPSPPPFSSVASQRVVLIWPTLGTLSAPVGGCLHTSHPSSPLQAFFFPW